MNVFYETLAQICQIRRLDEKWLLAPNLRIGQQWLDRVAFSGIPVVNARPKTLRRLAFDLAEPELRRRNLRRLEPLAGPLIVERIWKQTANPKGGYLGTLTPSAGLFASLYHSLMALRLRFDFRQSRLFRDHWQRKGNPASLTGIPNVLSTAFSGR